jgi:hypothetical protein
LKFPWDRGRPARFYQRSCDHLDQTMKCSVSQNTVLYSFAPRDERNPQMKKKLAIALATTIVFASMFTSPAAFAKRWTVTERLQKLSQEIDAGRKANELTVKQQDNLKKMVGDINAKIDKMQAKNGGKLSVPDTKKLHDDMTDISCKMLKMRLDNVYSN